MSVAHSLHSAQRDIATSEILIVGIIHSLNSPRTRLFARSLLQDGFQSILPSGKDFGCLRIIPRSLQGRNDRRPILPERISQQLHLGPYGSGVINS